MLGHRCASALRSVVFRPVFPPSAQRNVTSYRHASLQLRGFSSTPLPRLSVTPCRLASSKNGPLDPDAPPMFGGSTLHEWQTKRYERLYEPRRLSDEERALREVHPLQEPNEDDLASRKGKMSWPPKPTVRKEKKGFFTSDPPAPPMPRTDADMGQFHPSHVRQDRKARGRAARSKLKKLDEDGNRVVEQEVEPTAFLLKTPTGALKSQIDSQAHQIAAGGLGTEILGRANAAARAYEISQLEELRVAQETEGPDPSFHDLVQTEAAEVERQRREDVGPDLGLVAAGEAGGGGDRSSSDSMSALVPLESVEAVKTPGVLEVLLWGYPPKYAIDERYEQEAQKLLADTSGASETDGGKEDGKPPRGEGTVTSESTTAAPHASDATQQEGTVASPRPRSRQGTSSLSNRSKRPTLLSPLLAANSSPIGRRGLFQVATTSPSDRTLRNFRKVEELEEGLNVPMDELLEDFRTLMYHYAGSTSARPYKRALLQLQQLQHRLRARPIKLKDVVDTLHKDESVAWRVILSRMREGRADETIREMSEEEKTLARFCRVINIGRVKAEKFYAQGCRTFDDLLALPNLERSIRVGIKHFADVETYIPRSESAVWDHQISSAASAVDKDLQVMLCGSYRRGLELSSDLDFVVFHPDVGFGSGAEEKAGELLKGLIEELKNRELITDDHLAMGKKGYRGFVRLPSPPNGAQSTVRRIGT